MSQIRKKDEAEAIKIEHTFKIFRDHKCITESMADTMKVGQEMAIIGFWRRNLLNSKDVFSCYHYFYVPNPCKRETQRSDRGGSKKSTISC